MWFGYRWEMDRNHTIIHFSNWPHTTFHAMYGVFLSLSLSCMQVFIPYAHHLFALYTFRLVRAASCKSVCIIYMCKHAHNPKTNCSHTMTHAHTAQQLNQRQPFGKQICSGSFWCDLIRFHLYAASFCIFTEQNHSGNKRTEWSNVRDWFRRKSYKNQ